MQDANIHENDFGFEDHVEDELDGLAARAEEVGICRRCLDTRVVFEIVAGMVRSGSTASDILDIVSDALEAAGPGDPTRRQGGAGRMH